MPALQGVTPVCCCPASALVVPAPSGSAAFWALASPLHTQMALHGVRPSVSTKPAGAVGADWPLLALASCSVLLPSSHLSLPMALCGPLSLVFQGGQSRQKSIRAQGPTAIGELSQDEKPGSWVQTPHPDRMSCSRYPVSSFLHSPGLHTDFVTGLGTPAGETGVSIVLLPLPSPGWVKTWLLCTLMSLYLK